VVEHFPHGIYVTEFVEHAQVQLCFGDAETEILKANKEIEIKGKSTLAKEFQHEEGETECHKF
jgi:hypothetical protein